MKWWKNSESNSTQKTTFPNPWVPEANERRDGGRSLWQLRPRQVPTRPNGSRAWPQWPDRRTGGEHVEGKDIGKAESSTCSTTDRQAATYRPPWVQTQPTPPTCQSNFCRCDKNFCRKKCIGVSLNRDQLLLQKFTQRNFFSSEHQTKDIWTIQSVLNIRRWKPSGIRLLC